MNELERKLQDKNPRLTPRDDFVTSVMQALPAQPDEISRKRVMLGFMTLPFGAAIAGVATFAVLAMFVLPSVRDIGKPKEPEIARDSGAKVVMPVIPAADSVPVQQETIAQIPIEQEIQTIEVEVAQLEDEISSLESDLSDEVLGLN
jgi:hypothetical protein